MNVSEISKKTGMEQSVASHNLKRLENCGFLNKEIRGKYRYYSLNKKTIGKILDLIDDHMDKNCLKIIKNMKGGKQ